MALVADFDPELPTRITGVELLGTTTVDALPREPELPASGGPALAAFAVATGGKVPVTPGAGEFAVTGGDAVGGGEAVGVVTGAGEFAATGDCSEPAAGEAGAPATTTDVELAAPGGCAANAALVSTIEASQPVANNVTIRGIGGRDVPEDGRDLPT